MLNKKYIQAKLLIVLLTWVAPVMAAHVQDDGTHYSSQNGHAADGTEPDNPYTNAGAYKNYVNNLFSVASQATVMPRVSNSVVIDLADSVTKTEYGKAYLYDAIGSVTKAEATSMVRSPVSECHWFENCQKLDIGSQVDTFIRSILGAPQR